MTIGDGQDRPSAAMVARTADQREARGRQRDIHISFDCVAGAPGTVRDMTLFSLKGSIWRLSDRPMLRANTTLPARGGPMSLGGPGWTFALSVNA